MNDDDDDDVIDFPRTSAAAGGAAMIAADDDDDADYVDLDGKDDADNADADNDDEDDDDDGPTLRQAASRCCKRIDVGTAVMPKPLFRHELEDFGGDEALRERAASERVPTRYAKTAAREFNAVVVEHHLKWSPLCVSEPGPLPNGTPSERLGRYDFHLADQIVDWALENDLKVKGHVLVWSVTSPTALLEQMEPSEVRLALKRHIYTTMGHFRGRIQVWDVVNEPLAPDGSLAENVFLQKLGPTYVEEAFRWAHEVDPTATLLLNENKVEGAGTAKSERFYELMRDLKARGVPVHGCGLQAHFNAAGTGRNRPPTPRAVKQQIRRLGDLGLSVNFSELDVRVSQLPGGGDVRQRAQRQIYRDLVAAALSEPAFDGVWLWGFTDRHTWVTHFYYDDEPLVIDESYVRKQSYYALRSALDTIAPGGRVGGENPTFLESDYDADGVTPWGDPWISREVVGVGGGSPLGGGGDVGGADSSVGGGGDARPDWEIEPDAGSKEPDGIMTRSSEDYDTDEEEETDEDDVTRQVDDGGVIAPGSPSSDLPPIS